MANLSNINDKFLVTTGGNVLIGATADVAAVRLHVKNASAAAVLRLTGGNDSWDFDTDYTAHKLLIKSNGAAGTVMTLLGASGYVGIGDTSPQGKLEVNNRDTATGAALFIKGGEDDLDPVAGQYTGLAFGYGGGDIYNNGAILWEFTNTAANGKLHFAVNPTGGDGTANLSDSKMTILDSGNVGIGATSPSFQLSIENHATTSSIATFEIDGKRTNGTDGAVGEMIFSNNGDTFATIAGARDGADNSGSLLFQTQDSGTFGTRMTITSEGNVGIGTTSPAAPLAVQANFTANGSYTTSGWAKYIFLDAENTGGGGIIWTKQSSTYNRAILNNQGKFEIGRSTANDNSGAWLSDLAIDATGNVGIGTDSPSYGKLQVDQTSGNNLTLRKGTGQPAIAFGGVTNNEATCLIEGNGASGWLKFYNGTGTLASPTWSAGMEFFDSGRLYPYGGVYLGAASSSNLLDDYEEGTWTPQAYYQNATDQGNTTDNTTIGQYVKIGATVTVWIKLNWTITGSPVNDNVGIKNLPFQGTTTATNASIAVFLKNVSAPILQRIPTSSQTLSLWMGTDYGGNYGNEIGAGTHEIATSFTYLTDQ
jgi:hypothetical protein